MCSVIVALAANMLRKPSFAARRARPKSTLPQPMCGSRPWVVRLASFPCVAEHTRDAAKEASETQ
eukprot:4162157-Prorocentrum_lima.AAC.1